MLVKEYYQLIKPGIIRGNLITAAAAFIFASQNSVAWFVFLATLAGVALIIASGCVFNNYIDRYIDAKMPRTKNRSFVTGSIAPAPALLFATILGIFGIFVLFAYTNALTALIGLLGLLTYVVVYGIAKRRTVHGTLIGAIPGATPPLAGYTAVTGNLDITALLLFLILVFWQMPHFYAIAIYRLKDYKAAGIPVLPAVKGTRATKLQIMAYIAGFSLACAALTAYSYAGYAYLAVMVCANLAWLWFGLKGFNKQSDTKWAKQMFGISLVVLLIFSLMISLNEYLA